MGLGWLCSPGGGAGRASRVLSGSLPGRPADVAGDVVLEVRARSGLPPRTGTVGGPRPGRAAGARPPGVPLVHRDLDGGRALLRRWGFVEVPGELEDPVRRGAVVLPDGSERFALAWWTAAPRVLEHDEAGRVRVSRDGGEAWRLRVIG